MTSILYGVGAVVVGLLLMLVYHIVKVFFNPSQEVKEADSLGMSVLNYRKYVEADKKIQEIYRQYGTGSNKATRMVSDIIDALPNKNEWRRFMDAETQKSKLKF